MKWMIAAALASLALAAPDPFLFEDDSKAPILIEREDLALERVTSSSVTDGDVGFYERSTIRRQGDTVDVWLLVAFYKPNKLPDGVVTDGFWSSHRIDCAKDTVARYATSAVYENGRTVSRTNQAQAAYPIKPKSNFARVANILCGRLSNEGAPVFRSAKDAIASARAV